MVVLNMTRRWARTAAVLAVSLATQVAASGRPEGGPLRLQSGDQAAGSDVVEITAERFSFTPSEIRVKAGTKVVIRLRSEDTDHGFKIPGTDIDLRIPKRNRGTIEVTFDAAKAGRYTFQCSHVCGAGHSFMRGEIVVTE
jgi:cytochrome c oxidase subunit II